MMRKAKDDYEQTDKVFERQQRHLNRRRLLRPIITVALLAAAYLALQLTPYRNLPGDVFQSVMGTAKEVFSGPGQAESDPKYW